MKLHIIVFLVTLFYGLAAHSQTEINRAILTDTEANSKVAARSSICLNVYFVDGQENKNEADFKRKVKKHQLGFDINYWVKDADRTNSFRVLNYDLRDYHLLLITDYYWDCAKFNDLLSSQTPSINYSFKSVRVSEDSTKFEHLLMKNEGHCQLSGDFEVFFPIIELLLKEQEVSMSSSNRLMERRLKSSDEEVKSLSKELNKINAANEELKKSLADIKSNLDDANNDSGKLKVQLSYLPEIKNSQLSNQALSAKFKFRLNNPLFNVAVGYGQVNKQWSSSSFDYSQQRSNSVGNVPMNIVTQGGNIQDKYSLKYNAAIIGCELNLGDLKIGLDSWLPINSSLTCENKSGLFNYYGLSSQVLEPIENIPSLGLASNVSYLGEKSVFNDVMKTRFAFHAGYEMHVLKNMSFLPSLYFMSKSTLRNISDSENLTNGLGQYSSLIEYANSERNLSRSLYLNLSVCFKITK
jgi:hypothetical protein